MRNKLTVSKASLAVFLLTALVAGGLYARMLPPAKAASDLTPRSDFGPVSRDPAALETGAVETVATPINIPRLQCPIGTCKVGGFKFDVDWNCAKCTKCPANGAWKKHTGDDLKADPGTVVVAAEAGIVKYVYDAGPGWARAILIEHTNGVSKYVTQYMHVDPGVEAGAVVKRGDPIAKVAAISEPHLHFGVWAGPFGETADLRGALPSCMAPKTSCNDGTRTDPCFPQSWVDPLGFLDDTTLKTVYPNGGETWTIGSTQTIRWAYNGAGKAVKIELLKGGRLSQVIPASVVMGSNGSGSFNWTVPSLPPGTDYKIRVSSTQWGSVTDSSDGNFTISAGQAKAVVSTSLQLSPNNGPFRVGQKLRATFTITNRGNAYLISSKVLAGRVGGPCPPNVVCPDFPPNASINLAPGKSYSYSGTFTLPREGTYTFVVAYQKQDGSWDTNLATENGTKASVTITVQNAKTTAAATQETRQPGTALILIGDDDGKKIPLILVHGIHESDDASEITQRTHSWDHFIDRFKADQTLKDTYSLYTFQYYSDVEGVQDLATHLGNWIDTKLPDRKHVLLAHSMGGLVSKAYMADYHHRAGQQWLGQSGGDTTLLLITLATPHHGTPGANDAAAIQRYMGTGWYEVFSSINFLYWSKRAGFLSPPSLNSGTYNRSDLRWDNYDSSISTDMNLWLGPANRRFAAYNPKVIAYAGALQPQAIDAVLVSKAIACATAYPTLPSVAKLACELLLDQHDGLSFLNEFLVSGLRRQFGPSDGMVPYRSALLCDSGQFFSAPNTNFICSSPTRVRRFEPGTAGGVLPDPKTLSITRRPRGYDHLDMRDDNDVLNWVVKDLAIAPKAVVSTSLRLAQGKGPVPVGQKLDGTFSITNRGGANLVMNKVLIGGRVGGTCPNNTCPDFGPINSNITLEPGKTYNYSGAFTPSAAGSYTFTVTYQKPDGSWVNPVETENGTINQLTITVQSSQPKAVVSTSLRLSPNGGPYSVGQALTGSFSIANRGNANLVMNRVLIGGRVGDICPNNVCPDFGPVTSNITLAPGKTYNYSGSFTLPQTGTYTFSVAYQKPDGTWVIPVDSENGSVNRLSLVVQNTPPKLTGKSPAYLGANPNPQIIYLSGSGLAQTLYCYMQFPNGSGTYLYLPTGEVFSRRADQLGLKIKFTMRGTYYIWAHTMDGSWSNALQIVVN